MINWRTNNWRRALIRLWLALAIGWWALCIIGLILVAIKRGCLFPDHYRAWHGGSSVAVCTSNPVLHALGLATVPLIVWVLGVMLSRAALWIARGFQRKAGG